MSHHHLEIIMPPTENISAAVDLIMKKFHECPDTTGMDEDEKSNADYDVRYAFYDWYVIGGRWAGSKMMAKYDPKKLEDFYKWLTDEKVTVSGVRAGKEELSPASQIPKVDKKWNEMFPSDKFVACPIFNHSNDQYGTRGESTIDGDICKLSEISPSLTASRVIIANTEYDPTNSFSNPAAFMVTDSYYNGVNWSDSKWNGKVVTALKMYDEHVKIFKKQVPTEDWLVVTVDYHS